WSSESVSLASSLGDPLVLVLSFDYPVTIYSSSSFQAIIKWSANGIYSRELILLAIIIISRKMTWNDRFCITDSRGNGLSNHYYREYFDKPSRKTDCAILQPKRAFPTLVKKQLKPIGFTRKRLLPKQKKLQHKRLAAVRNWN
ncbi:MAG: hypothetical protein V2I33_23075, partial [Kangiellaceae bacterium]|nr:hypothetical protein [Kangiellaceae bacterium]